MSEFPEFQTWLEMQEFIEKQIAGNFTVESDSKTSLHILLQLVEGVSRNFEHLSYRIDRTMEVASGPK